MSEIPEPTKCSVCGFALFYGDFCVEHRPRRSLDTPDLFTVGKAAQALRVPASEVRAFVDRFGPSVRDGRRIRVRLEDIRPWLADRESARRNLAQFMASTDDH